MTNLRQISGVSENITAASKKSIKALHHLVFREIGDRNNRSRLREFSGSEFADYSEEYQEKDGRRYMGEELINPWRFNGNLQCVEIRLCRQ